MLTFMVAMVGLLLSCATLAENTGENDVGRSHQPPTSKNATTKSGATILTQTAAQNSELRQDLLELDRRVTAALGAVNYNLMRYPHCVDELFQTSADLDLGRRALTAEQRAIENEIATLRRNQQTGALRLEDVNRMRTRVQIASDRVTILNAELAMLFTRTMRRESPCGDIATG